MSAFHHDFIFLLFFHFPSQLSHLYYFPALSFNFAFLSFSFIILLVFFSFYLLSLVSSLLFAFVLPWLSLFGFILQIFLLSYLLSSFFFFFLSTVKGGWQEFVWSQKIWFSEKCSRGEFEGFSFLLSLRRMQGQKEENNMKERKKRNKQKLKIYSG